MSAEMTSQGDSELLHCSNITAVKRFVHAKVCNLQSL